MLDGQDATYHLRREFFLELSILFRHAACDPCGPLTMGSVRDCWERLGNFIEGRGVGLDQVGSSFEVA